MAVFNIGDKQETAEPQIEVTVTVGDPLKVGTHRFQLIVVDDDGNESAPAIAEIVIRDLELPTAVLQIQPKSVEFGKSFTLLGENSSDVGSGSIKKYIWQRLD